MLKLSIITINYNNAEGLNRTIKSIINQTYKEFEYIIIDGHSNDQSTEIIKSYQNYIDYWISEPDSGIYNAMNKGIKQAKGEYLLFINSGDTLTDQSSLFSVINDVYDEDLVYFNLNVINDTNNEYTTKTYPPKLDFKYFIEDSLPHMATFIKKQKLINYGYYEENMKIISDWAFFIDAICILNYSYRWVDKSFSVFNIGGISSLPQNFSLLREEKNKHIAEKYPLINTLFQDYISKRQELYRLKSAISIRTLKKIGFLKWLNL